MKKVKYLVMQINTEVVTTVNGHKIDVKMDKCAGYSPIFNTLKQAEKNSNGKFQILPIRIRE